MNPQNWSPRDISEQPCPRCSTPVEFWKDDVKRRCTSCGFEIINRTLATSCISWCDQAAGCTGSAEIDDWKKRRRGGE
jgi:hypothetical protein